MNYDANIVVTVICCQGKMLHSKGGKGLKIVCYFALPNVMAFTSGLLFLAIYFQHKFS